MFTPMRGDSRISTSALHRWRNCREPHERSRLRAGFMKKHVLGQTLIRRNPFYYDRSWAVLEQGETWELRAASHLGRAAGAAHAAARETYRYGRSSERRRHARELAAARQGNVCGTAYCIHHRHTMALRARDHGGTSGVPLKVLRSLEAIVFEQADHRSGDPVGGRKMRARRAPRCCAVTIRATSKCRRTPIARSSNGGRIMTMSANAVTHTSVERIAESLENFAPQLLCAYPSALETLARYLRDSGRRLSIPSVVTSSEVFRADAWLLVEKMLGCRLVDYYGQAERIAFAFANAPRDTAFSTPIRASNSFRTTATRSRATASSGCTRSSEPRSGTACCPSCATAPAISCGCRRAGANRSCWSCRWDCARSRECSGVSRN